MALNDSAIMGLAANAHLLAEFDPERVKREVIAGMFPDFLECFQSRLKRGCSKAMRLYAQIAGWVGAQTDVGVLVIQQIGVPMDRAKHAVALVEDAQALSEESRVSMAVEFLNGWNRLHPERAVSLEAA